MNNVIVFLKNVYLPYVMYFAPFTMIISQDIFHRKVLKVYMHTDIRIQEHACTC